ncbi:MAG: hypothetical protein AAGJ85_01485 [Pseudomonadota bacterium]
MSLTALAILALPFSQSASAEIAAAEQERLNTCIEMVETDPQTAYEDSIIWLGSGNRPRARYCNAISLLALEYYEEGAARLEALANAPDAIALEDRARYMAQAGNAWLTASYPDAAVTALSEAIKIDPRNGDYYKDRATGYLALERWFEAIDDLTASLDLQPNDPDALSLRARAHLGLNDLRNAEIDMQAALAQDPRNIDILLLRGDVREAIRLSRELQ